MTYDEANRRIFRRCEVRDGYAGDYSPVGLSLADNGVLWVVTFDSGAGCFRPFGDMAFSSEAAASVAYATHYPVRMEY